MNDLERILDIFYAKDGQEPDWAEIKTAIFWAKDPVHLLFQVLESLWNVYEIEDFAVIRTNIFALTEGL
jgi:hypothetical protein